MSFDKDNSLLLPPLVLGGFELKHTLGKGGMAQVFLATHQPSQQQVALKLLLPQRAQDLRWRQSLRHEALAMAKMRHVHIASLIDFGSIDEVSAVASQGRLVEGSFWYAMELVGGQTLRRHAWLSCWEQLSEVVLALLDALSHAHARGVIHRDLKPDNILVRLDGLKLQALKLLDFGIALSGQAEPSTSQDKLKAVLGTPTYMAPEQIQGERTAQGPWTDLYALGCLVWRLVCGQPPFRQENTLETLKGHLYSPLPVFEPRFAVPDELEQWLSLCLDKAPSKRFGSASQAAAHWRKMEAWLPKTRHLETYTPRDAQDADGQTRAPLELPTVVISKDGHRATTTAHTPSQGISVSMSKQEQLITVYTQSAAPSLRMAVPLRWGRSDEAIYRPPGWRISARLIRVRPPPLIGRAQEREVLWDALVRVAQINVCELMTLEGPVGVGKSALMRWMTERAAELGAAQIVHITHHDPPSPGDGLWGALARFYGLNLMPTDLAAQQTELEVALGAHLGLEPEQAMSAARALCGLVFPGEDASWQRDLNAIMSWLELICLRGPLILAIDDLQRGYEAAELARALLDRSNGLPVLILATCAEPQRDGVELWRQALWSHPRHAQVLLEPLGRDQCAVLCDELYQLPAHQRAMICQGAHGLPSHVVDGVDALVTHGELALAQKTTSFSLAAQEATPEQQAQELLAVLGQSAPLELLVEVVTASGLSWQPLWLEQWVEQGLVRVAHEVISLERASLAQALRQQARQSGRWAAHHARALEVLMRQRLDPTGLERAAHHAIESEDEPLAMELLHRAASGHFVMSRRSRALSLLHRRAALIVQRDGEAITEDKVFNATLLLHVMMDTGDQDTIKEQAQTLERWFAMLPNPSCALKLRWLYSRMRLHLIDAEFSEAVALFEQADLKGEVDESQGHGAHCVRNWALALEDLGLLKQAWLAQLRALSAYLALDDSQGAGFVCYRLGYIALALGLVEHAEALAHVTLAHFERVKIFAGVTSCRFLLMDVALAQENPRQAAHHIKSVELRFDELSPEEQWLTHLNRAHIEIFEHQLDLARETLKLCLRPRHQLPQQSWMIVQLLQLILLADERDWSNLERLYQRWIEQMTSSGAFFKDTPWALRRIAQLCLEGGRAELVKRFERDAQSALARHEQQRAIALEALTPEQLKRPFEALAALSQR